MAELGVFVGNEPEQLSQFENWVGRPADGVLGFIGGESWEDIGNPGWAVDLWEPTGRPVYWSVPLIPNDGSTLADAASGNFDSYFRSAAEQLKDASPMPDGKVYIRTGWEMGGEWFPWGADGDPEDFVAAYQNFVDAFRSVDDSFVFEWNVVGDRGPVEQFYPGDEYVDIIGQDFYWNPEWTSSDPAQAFEMIKNQERGLQWIEDFADAHGKPTAYSEWGAQGDNAGPFLDKAQDWFESHDVVQASYWDSDSAYPGQLSDGSHPATGAAFIENFGGDGTGADWGDSADAGAVTTEPATSEEEMASQGFAGDAVL